VPEFKPAFAGQTRAPAVKTKATVAFGQGLSVTAIALIAYGVMVANLSRCSRLSSCLTLLKYPS
jgi:cell division protein FtsI/penicillin-binding protein 2